MTTQAVAQRYHELMQTGQIEQVLKELYSPDIISLEPLNDSQLPRRTEGMAAYREKEKLYFGQIEQMYASFLSPPAVSTVHFTVMLGMDVTIRGKSRKEKKEIGVFEVRDGKIVREEWFYDDFI
ncbi:MAG: SnoaL-like domain-containing protein [Lewinella sp.]